MFLFILQYFTGLKLHGARQSVNQLIATPQQKASLKRCRITHPTSPLQGMNGWCCKWIREHRHQMQAACSWWKMPCRSCQLAWKTGIRPWTVLNNTAGLLPELVNHDGFIENLLQDFFFFFCSSSTFPEYKAKTFSPFQILFFIFPICNYVFAHLSYTWSIVNFLAKNGMAAVGKKQNKTNKTVQYRKYMDIIEEKVMWYHLPQARCLN